MTQLASIIPAAGLGTRMRGGDKLTEQVDGVALLRRIALAASSVSARVIVALPDPAGARGAALDGLDVLRIPVPDAAEGMARSLVRAARAVPENARGILILPADMPEITAADLRHLAQHFAEGDGQRILRATTENGAPGHPVIFPSRFRAALTQLTGDAGARDILAAEAEAGCVDHVALPANRARVDLDTPEDWARWRAAQGAGRMDG
ncbi:NTP transferase domain-containing protein [Roseivivax sp. THAF40]|uniref:nucleotidyltransferase family protein n=1 Tax=Roseivivax sp. THAF40 TaxID=2587858 RepID=UPI0012682E69|nr:nucleotidyltransferase family protein [Roseivivax sp. THAF40]